jgi:hypothetical protein
MNEKSPKIWVLDGRTPANTPIYKDTTQKFPKSHLFKPSLYWVVRLSIPVYIHYLCNILTIYGHHSII